MDPNPRRSRTANPNQPNAPRKTPSSGGINVWMIVLVAVIFLTIIFLVTRDDRAVLEVGQLEELIEQRAPDADHDPSIIVTEKRWNATMKVRYSKLANVKIGPYDITGTVTREVLEPEAMRAAPQHDVVFSCARGGPEHENSYWYKLLKENHFQDYGGESRSHDWSFLLFLFLSICAVLALLWIVMRKLGGTGSAVAFGRSRGKLLAQEDIGVTFDDVAGVEEAVDELREVVDFLRLPEKYQILGGRIPKGILLVGPPGTGKTMLGKAVAGEAGVPFFSLSGSDFVEMFVGVGAARVRDMFQQAVAKAPCIIFIDELDALGKTRGASSVSGQEEREQTLNALLVEMDGVTSNSGVIVLAATNRPETLDPALLRPGRFDRHVLVDRPDVRGREQILDVHLHKIRLSDDVNVKELAKITSGFVGADLANLVNEAALLAARAGKTRVTMHEFAEGVDRVTAGLEKRQRIMQPDEKKRVAYHEAGHALVAASLPNTDPVHKVSIIPRGLAALGYTLQRPEGDRYLMTQSELESRIQVLMAGSLAEEIIFGDISTGAQNDLQHATEIARGMVMDYGMSRLGRIAFRESGRSAFVVRSHDPLAERSHSEQTAREIDEEITHFLAGNQELARQILLNRRRALQAIAEQLIDLESIDNAELHELIDGHTPSAMIVPGTTDVAKTAHIDANKTVGELPALGDRKFEG
jgi:cell division protease FtsH